MKLDVALLADDPASLVAATEAHPGWDEPHILLAQALRANGDWAGAEIAYRKALDIAPRRLEPLVALGAHFATTDPAQARALLTRACAEPTATWEAWHALGVACLAGDAPHDAVTALDHAAHLAPGRLDIVLLRGEAAFAAGDLSAELARLSLADFSHPDTMVARAAVFNAAGQPTAALDELEAAAAIAPAHAPALAALGSLLVRLNRHRDAELNLRRAVAAGTSPQARLDLATVLMRRHHMAEALTLLDGLAEDIGPDTVISCNRAVTLCALGQQDEAAATAREAARADPGVPLPWRTLCNVLPYTPSATAAKLCAAAHRVAASLTHGVPIGKRPAPARLRVGVLSGSLRTHPVAWLTLAGFENLDPGRFDLVCLGPRGTDAPARRFAAASSAWIDTTDLSDPELAATARTANLDIVLDAGGHGDNGRMAACTHRLAPVQAKWVGMQNATTGLPEMDWFITDRWETPDHLARHYSERLLVMPDGYVCYTPPPYTPAVAPSPAEHRGHVTFGCFHNLAKVTPDVIAAWSRILHAVPRARLILKNHQMNEAPTRARIAAAFAAYGVADRIELRGASNHGELLRQYADVDIVLDAFPYGGGLTTCEALWMGVPTVTLPGDFFAARHSLSHLSNAGLTGWDAADGDSYVALAAAKASDTAALAHLRATLRNQLRASPLCDAPRFGRNLGAALERMWDET